MASTPSGFFAAGPAHIPLNDAAAQLKDELATWNIIYQLPTDACDDKSQLLRHYVTNDNAPRRTTWFPTQPRRHAGCAHFQQLPLAAARDGHRLHGDDREPAIRLDAVRRSDRREKPLGPRRDPARLHDLRGDGNLAGPDRSLVRRQIRSEHRRDVRRRDDHAGLGAEFLCRLADAALCRRRHRRHRRRLRCTAPASAMR